MATYRGTPDDDVLIGGMEDDVLLGMEGNDVLEGGAGADEIDGGDDDGRGAFLGSARTLIWGDTARYVQSDAGVTIDLAAGTAEGGHAEGDTLTGIESVRASHHADVLVARLEGSTLYGQRGDDSLTGGDGWDYLWGGKGDDTLTGGGATDYLEGGAGADMLDGGDGFGDTAGYELSDAGVTVDLSTGTGQGGHAEGDTLANIARLWGSPHGDHFIGNDQSDRLEGLAGDDTLDGGGGDDWLFGGAGADVLDGGDGRDLALYLQSDAGVTVNLSTGEGQGGHAEGDALMNIEDLHGSRNHADHLIGTNGDDSISGWRGDDTIEGGAGNDWLVGGAGADMIDGGDGNDTVDYPVWDPSDAGVTVDLAAGTGQGGYAEGDTFTSIENVRGSEHADHLTGDDGDNRLEGHGGDDTLGGGAGSDTLDGQDGLDLLAGGEGADTFVSRNA